MKVCSIEGCRKGFYARGWCSKHYARWIRTGDAQKLVKPQVCRLCSVDYCFKKHSGHGYCVEHYDIWRTSGDPLKRTRAKQGTGWLDRGGYRIISINGRQVRNARNVLELKLGRKLLPGEEAHHLNKIRDDDRPENIEAKEKSLHSSDHHKKRFIGDSEAGCIRCRQILPKSAFTKVTRTPYIRSDCKRCVRRVSHFRRKFKKHHVMIN